MGILLCIACALPLLLLVPLALPAARPWAMRAAPWAALPALLAALLPGNAALPVPWLVLGGLFALDSLARGFLFFTAALWLAAGIYAHGYLKSNQDTRQAVFFGHFLGTMGGNLCLIPAQDVLSFVSFFAIMSYSAYGLVVHYRNEANFFAGRIYIAMTLLGEVAAFGGLVWAACLAGGNTTLHGLVQAIAGAPERGVLLSLVFLGFGVKLGVLPLHMWLPLAHPAAPTPASAVLSGVMIKTGLLLWLRVFPFDTALPVPGALLLSLGVCTAFAAAFMGMAQTNPKALLAYSSISQMGIAAIGVGIGFASAQKSGPVLAALLVFAAHHAFAKGALFLGVGIAATALSKTGRRLLFAGLALSGGALAGLPFTSGLAAKTHLTYLAKYTGAFWGPALGWLLPLTSVTTALLVIRFLVLVAPPPREPHGRANGHMVVPWAVMTLAALLFPWALVAAGWADLKHAGLYAQGVGGAAWPLLCAVAVAAVVWKMPALRTPLTRITLPPGDLVYPVLRLLAFAGRAFDLAVLRPAAAAETAFAGLRAQVHRYHGTVLQRMARQESFALGMLFMAALALGMAFIL